MAQSRCKCGRIKRLSQHERDNIRRFMIQYPWVKQKHMAILFNISKSRISEIMRGI